jgi:hypothetical protein
MKDISLSEAYFLCAVQDKGKVFGYDTVKIACLLVAVFYELEQAGSVRLTEHAAVTVTEPPSDLPGGAAVYERLTNMDSPEWKEILRDYSNPLTDWHLNTLATAIGNSLAEKKLATRAKLGLFQGRTYYLPQKNALPGLAAELMVNIMYSPTLQTEDGLLWLLLEKGNCVPKALPMEQRDAIHNKVTNALNSEPEGELAGFSRFIKKLLSMTNAAPV